MSNPISTYRKKNVALVSCDNPPVNAVGQAVRAGLALSN